MTILIAAILAVFPLYGPLYGQSKPEWKAAKGNFDNMKPGDLTFKPPHIHTVGLSCKGKADGVYSKSGGVYYACIKGRDVCSKESGAVPGSMITEYDTAVARHSVRQPLQQKPAQSPARATRAVRPTPVVAAARIAPATPRPAAVTLTEEQVNSVAVGATRQEVIQKLGEPYTKLNGDVERLTYRLASGNSAKLDFEGGKLAQVRVVP